MSDKAPPWRVTVAVAEISDTTGMHRDITAGEAERQAIATLAGVRELPSLTASFDLAHAGGGRVRVSGRVTAVVGQTCVVTLEPLSNEINEPVDVMFIPEAQRSAALPDAVAEDLPDEEPPGLIINGEIDLGSLAAEFLILGLDPYPRKEGAVFEPMIQPIDPSEHPFAALAALKGSDPPARPKRPKSESGSKSKGK